MVQGAFERGSKERTGLVSALGTQQCDATWSSNAAVTDGGKRNFRADGVAHVADQGQSGEKTGDSESFRTFACGHC